MKVMSTHVHLSIWKERSQVIVILNKIIMIPIQFISPKIAILSYMFIKNECNNLQKFHITDSKGRLSPDDK